MANKIYKILNKVLIRIEKFVDDVPATVATKLVMRLDKLTQKARAQLEKINKQAEDAEAKSFRHSTKDFGATLILFVTLVATVFGAYLAIMAEIALRETEYSMLFDQLERAIPKWKQAIPTLEKMNKDYTRWVIRFDRRISDGPFGNPESTESRYRADFSEWVYANAGYKYDDLRATLRSVDSRQIGELARRIRKNDPEFGSDFQSAYSTVEVLSTKLIAFWYDNGDGGADYNPDWTDIWLEAVEDIEELMTEIEDFIEAVEKLDPESIQKDIKKAEKEVKKAKAIRYYQITGY